MINLSEYLKGYPGNANYKNLFFNPSKDNSLILVSSYGILKTEDGGLTWVAIPLLTEPGKADIRAVAVDPLDDRIIYYVTRNIFYRTINNGSDWETKKMFSTKLPSTNFIVNPENRNVMYLGFTYP